MQAQSVTDYASHLNNVQQQFDAGIVAKLDVLSSNVSLANAKQKSIAADNTRDVAEANLNNIMRIPMNTTLAISRQSASAADTAGRKPA
ncbi:Outer membrane efflux protein [Bacteroides xylanisolvens]|nr:Outer membrane efflux protein [Bacteroides xylanisolvens]